MPSPSWARIGLTLSLALLAGLAVRQWAYEQTSPIRFELNQQNSFYWGNRIVHGTSVSREGSAAGPADWKSFWRNYVAVYAADEARPAVEPHQLDYVPLRLLMAGAWVQYLNLVYGPALQWRPEFARSFAAFSMIMELAGGAAMFALVARWLKTKGPVESGGILPKHWGRWEQATAAAILLWMNPASIVDSHIWPHGQTWILPFYLFAVLAMVEGQYFLAGALFGLGSMFKGQMMLVAPVLILWPLFDRRWRGGVRVVLGMACGVGIVAWPWLIRGSMAWARAGFAARVGFSDTLRKGVSLNLPAMLERHWHMTLHQQIVDQLVLGMHVQIELRTVLIGIYALLLACSSWGIARQARQRDRRLLLSIAAPWAGMFFILGQMDERYLVWSACFSAGALAVNRRALAAHVMLSLAGAATMFEFLLICEPGVWSGLLHVLIAMNPVIWLMTAVAVALVFLGSMGSTKGATKAEEKAVDPKPSLGRLETGSQSMMGITWGSGRRMGQSANSQPARRIPPSSEQSAA